MVSDNNTSTWLAAYLYYNEPWEEFLVKAVHPYIKTVMLTGIAQQFYFIRYWDRGPHIRLRFKGDVDILSNILKPNLKEHFNNYFESKASVRTEPEYPDDLRADYKWYPNNSIQYFDYEPEIQRYGGVVGMSIAEAQFEASTRVVLENIKESGKDWDYDAALGTAVKLHLSFIHAIGFDLQEASDFCEMIFYSWLPLSFSKEDIINTDQGQRNQSEETIAAFERAYDLQKNVLVSFHASFWEALNDQDDFEEDSLNQWIATNKKLYIQLKTAQEDGQLEQRKLSYQCNHMINNSLTDQQRQLWEIGADYMHMTNNRLGIFNKDEGYLAYLIMKSIGALKKAKGGIFEVKRKT